VCDVDRGETEQQAGCGHRARIADRGADLPEEDPMVGETACKKRLDRMSLALARECVRDDGAHEEHRYPGPHDGGHRRRDPRRAVHQGQHDSESPEKEHDALFSPEAALSKLFTPFLPDDGGRVDHGWASARDWNTPSNEPAQLRTPSI
jgi:hypothetical protein